METATASALDIQVLQENLANALDIVKPAMASRPTVPVLYNVKLETAHGRLKVTATDLDMMISAYVGAKVDCEGAMTLPYRYLRDNIKASPQATVQLRETAKNHASIECGRAKLGIDGITPEDFPMIPERSGTEVATFQGQDFAAALKYVEKCAHNDDTRPVLTGVLVEIEAGKVKFVTADGFRLAVRSVAAQNVGADARYLVPAPVMAAVAKIATRDKRWPEEITLVIGEKDRLHFAIGRDVEVTGLPIQGTYPSYKALIPPKFVNTYTVNRDALATMIKRAEVTARDGSGILRVYPRDDSLTIYARAETIGTFAGDVDATTEALGTAPFAFNSRYMVDALAVADTDVRILWNDSSNQFSVASADGLWIIMPMAVAWDDVEVAA
jgi:DNA polymerase-3 subunit beta